MRLRITTLVCPLLVVFVYGANAEPAMSGTGSSLYPPGLLPLISRADTLLSIGQFSDAAKAYSEAIDQAPTDYLLYYKRATAYYSLNRHPAALADFDQVISLTGDTFDNAYLMKARIHAKEGRFSHAREAIKRYTLKNKGDKAAQEVLFEVSEGEMAGKKANQAMKAKLWQACVEAASTALQTASHSVELRQLRADCELVAGDIEGAVGDFTRLTHLTTPSATFLMKIFRLAYFLLPYSPSAQSPALSALKQCLHYDPDSKQCLPAHRLMKAFDKIFKKLERVLADEDWTAIVDLLIGIDSKGFATQFEDALESNMIPGVLALPKSLPMQPALRISPRREMILRALCKAYLGLKEPTKGERWCEELSKMEGRQNDEDALVGRAEAMFIKEEWEAAVRLLEKAFEASGRTSREIHQRLQKAQKLLKQSRQKDYYKVLGVSRDADGKTIKKAFRKAAMKAHPDKGGSETKMATVNEAYEVLSNPELRQRFDNGDDPNDPMAAQGGPFPGGAGGHPFAQFFQQSGSGGFPGGFQFHFSPPGHHGRGR